MPDDKSGGDQPTPTLGTMQLPRGGKIEDLAIPPTGPVVTVPPMPAEWRYAVSAEIARGGMGRVVEATDNVLCRTVALKEALSRDPDVLRRFQREIRITARLEHPSIVPVHDAGSTPNGAPFYVMRKISGRPLEELVARGERLEDRLALLRHVIAAAHALAHAHERGVVHRDLKPSNILVGEQGETMVIDWGLAKVMGEPEPAAERPRAPTADPIVDDDRGLKTRAGIVFGTPGFMAPEQLRGEAADEKCDVYALGATLYHLLARRPPHHSTDPDDMMRAAMEGPPTPLRELVPGVPPALATIVDKALAHDRDDRYPDARAVAEDLERFITGRLVASHSYSRRERLVRFVRDNRALVAVSAGAALALATVGMIAIARIVDERDRADRAREVAVRLQKHAEEQEAVVRDSFNALTLTAARTKIDDDPTTAVAMVAPLATETTWRQARAIAAAARAHGVAFGLPASPRVLSLELSRDGQRALAAGDDGIVRLYDLGKRSYRDMAAVGGPATARFADGEHAIVVAHGDRLAIVDAVSGRQRELAARSPIAQLAASGPIAYWTDATGALWKVDVAGGAPERVALDEHARALSTSPDGRWIAVASDARLTVLDRTQPRLPPQVLAEGNAREMAWAATGDHLVALVGDDVVECEMPSGTITHRFFVGNRFAAADVRGQLFAAGPTGVAVVQRGDTRGRHVDGAYTLGLHEAPGGVVITGSTQGLVAVISPDDEQILHAPGMHLTRLEASPGSPWLVAASDGRLLVWNIRSVAPRRTADGASSASFVTGDQLVAAFGDGPAQWIDLRTDKATPLGAIPGGIRAIVPAPDGARALVIDGTHHGTLVAPGVPASEVAGEIEGAAFVDDTRLVVATRDGAVRLDDAGTSRTHAGTSSTHAGASRTHAGTSRVLVQKPAVLAVAARGEHVAAVFAGAIWRESLATAHADDVAVDHPSGALAVARGGDVVFGAGKDVRVWRTDGVTATLASYDKPVTTLAIVEPATVLALGADGALHVLDLRRAGGEPTAPLVAPHASIADSGLAAAISGDGLLEIVDPLARPGETWTLATPRGRAFGYAQIAPDGSRVLAVTATGVLVWSLALPPTPDATASWLAGLTNAIASPDGAIRWR